MRTSSLAVFILSALVLLTLAATRVSAATPPGGRMAQELIKKQTPATAEPGRSAKIAEWISKISVSPLGAIRGAEITGRNDWGFGLDLGVPINRYASLHLVNLAYEDHDWRTSAIDDTALNLEYQFKGFSTDSFSPYATFGSVHSWSQDDWGFSFGLGAKFKFNEYFSAGADYSLRAWFDTEEDSLARFYLQISY